MRASAPLQLRQALRFRPLPTLPNASVETFRKQAFDAAKPCLLPALHFGHLPATSQWFRQPQEHLDGAWQLNDAVLEPFGNAMVQTELVAFASEPESRSATAFTRAEAPLAFFLAWVRTLQLSSPFPAASGQALTIAQAPLAQLPAEMQAALPTPQVVREAGTGDVYDASLWLGIAPTVTPLHRDPNPNVLVQLAGRKHVRLLSPDRGRLVRRALGLDGKEGQEGMMAGGERAVLEEAMWENQAEEGSAKGEEVVGWEGEIGAGDGIFIPKGWWHAVHGVGIGVTASVNWWFR